MVTPAMVRTIYIEEEALRHPRTESICDRFPDATRVVCERYGEVFNPHAQSFRLQKRSPALILARKHSHHVQATPEGYGIGGNHNYYFSHMLNCLYDCRYCFLQGMFQSAHYVVFVNFEDFAEAIERHIVEAEGDEIYFFSGYDCDSLAFEPVTGFADFFLDFFAGHERAWIELRTKSARVEALLDRPPMRNCIVAFSFTPEEIGSALEHKVPSIERRLSVMKKLEQRGWTLGLRFDPLIYQEGYESQYRALFERVFDALQPELLHSVSLGAFRLPRAFFRKMVKLYPEEKLFASALEERQGMISYRRELGHELLGFCTEELLRYIPPEVFFPCFSGAELS